jgi:hypothetical protein
LRISSPPSRCVARSRLFVAPEALAGVLVSAVGTR